MSSRILDCGGLACPQPVIMTKKTVESDQPDSLTVIVDNEPALENVSRFLSSQGYAVDSVKEADNWHITATRQQGGGKPSPQQDKPSAPAEKKTAEEMKTVVLIVSPVMGTGDDELGSKLIKNFLATLPELGESLWRIVILNGGVKLATKNSHVLAELQALEQAGVDILVCGTCLEHFSLLADKAVGQTTNMLDVVTSLQLADKVLRV